MDAHSLEEYGDFDLCDYVFCKFPGNELNVGAYGEVERVITLVWHAFGIISNGGFLYLFSGSFKGDPDFKFTRDAFGAIGAMNAVNAFDEAFKHFSNNELPKSVDERTEIYKSVAEHKRSRIDCLFFDCRDEIEKRLAGFIRANRDEVISLIS